MNKISKKIKTLICVVLLFGLGMTNISANGNEDISTRAPVCVETTQYIANKTTRNNQISRQGDVSNPAASTIVRTYTFTRKYYASASVSGNYTSGTALSLISGKIQIAAEVEVGTNLSETESTQISVPPYTSIHFEFGTKTVSSSGYIQRMNSNCTTTRTNASANYSYADYISTWNI